MELWLDILGEFKPETILTVCKQITASSEWPPPVATVRKACINIERGTLRAVSAPEAWDSVVAYKNKKKTKGQLSALELRALRHIGGTWEMKMNEKPSILRSQFMNAYIEYLKTVEAERVALPETRKLIASNVPLLQGVPIEKSADKEPAATQGCIQGLVEVTVGKMDVKGVVL
jgi:hypothetical protein